MKKLIILGSLFALLSGFTKMYSQKYSYKISKTNQISSFNEKLSFSRTYNYNPETKVRYDYQKLKTRVNIRIDKDGKGKFEIAIPGDKFATTIESVYEKTYDSGNIHWKFKCRTRTGKYAYYYMDIKDNIIYRIWYLDNTDVRKYYYNKSI